MILDILELRNNSHAIGHQLKKRQTLLSIGSVDRSQVIKGSHIRIMPTPEIPSDGDQDTLIRKGAHQLGRIFESGADLASAPVQWLKSMQQNWPIYLVCITALLICALIFYFCIRRKLSSLSLSRNDLLKLSYLMPHRNQKSHVGYMDRVMEI